MENNNQQNFIFRQKEIENFAGFYNAIKKIHNRLIREGYVIKDGQIIEPKGKATIHKS